MLHDYKSHDLWQKNRDLHSEHNILVVEDDPCLVKFWKRILEDMPEYSSTIFNNPIGALNWLKNNSPDLLVTDLSMPGMDGTSLIRCVLQKNPDTKVILTTGFVPEPNDFNKLGARIHLVPKPYTNMTHLNSLIQLLLSEEGNFEKETESISVWNI